jgi:hypothetical protein
MQSGYQLIAEELISGLAAFSMTYEKTPAELKEVAAA